MTLTTKAAEQIQTMSADVLAALVDGEIDVHALLRAELAARGLNTSGQWVGFDAAKVLA